tara:strand:- start:5984 stop:7435 length:1452 start_codon:yes stop_codon:yes gene_type:complete
MSATNQCIIEEFLIHSDRRKEGEKPFDLTPFVASIDYFEDIFSPCVTLKVLIVNEAQVVAEDEEDTESTDDNLKSLYQGLPLRGGEICRLKIGANVGTNIPLDFSEKVQDYLYVTGISNVIRDSKRELFTLNLTSREAIVNETVRCFKKYSPDQNIGATVENILSDTLGVEQDRYKVELTSNSYGFIGNLKKPFPTITWLAKKSVTKTKGGGSAGFLFYQTKSGYKFRSVDTLMRQETYKLVNESGDKLKAPPFYYGEATQGFDGNDRPVNTDFKILKFAIQQNSDILRDLRLGTYCTSGMYFNPYNFEFESKIYKRKDEIKKDNMSLMGSEDPTRYPLKLDPDNKTGSDDTIEDSVSRTLTGISDIGVLAREDTNHLKKSDPLKFQMQSVTRYNTLFTNVLEMMIPLNSNLEAGMCVECEFPPMSTSGPAGDAIDSKQSGVYIIKELCHHYDVEKSYTSMKLLKDFAGDNPDRVEEQQEDVD